MTANELVNTESIEDCHITWCIGRLGGEVVNVLVSHGECRWFESDQFTPQSSTYRNGYLGSFGAKERLWCWSHHPLVCQQVELNINIVSMRRWCVNIKLLRTEICRNKTMICRNRTMICRSRAMICKNTIVICRNRTVIFKNRTMICRNRSMIHQKRLIFLFILPNWDQRRGRIGIHAVRLDLKLVLWFVDHRFSGKDNLNINTRW